MSRARDIADGKFANDLTVTSGNIKLDGNYPTGSNNVAMGDGALDDGSLSGASNTAIGNAALGANTTGTQNTSVGAFSGDAVTTGSDNTFVGKSAGGSITTGSSNTAVGEDALLTSDTASNNVAVGSGALRVNTTGYSNTALGTVALAATTTGRDNTAIGHAALDANTTANNNVAIGKNALGVNTTGASNTAVGTSSLDANTTASNNTAIGTAALGASTTATSMVAVGERAGSSVTTSSDSTFIGQIAGRDTTGNKNTFIGQQAGVNVTNGNKNTILGRYNGNQDGLDIRTLSNRIVLSDGDGNVRLYFNNAGEMHIQDTGSFNNTPAQSNTAGGLSYRPTAQLEVQGNNTQAAFFGRTNDGELIRFFSAGTNEGAITVSGTTVSYVGGHLSRWSQLADNTKDTNIVKGTVMTNLDQMAVWSHEEVLWTADDELPDGVSVGDVKTAAYTEDNEQLNCMAVSSVEGDANVAGVFVNWDHDDDDFNDMNIAMTGDMVIRIASGTTVARGDLLMSAGDGTAKPQGDDIVRSKTIAKVTSTNVSHTYDDGSYLVPCVLMAC